MLHFTIFGEQCISTDNEQTRVPWYPSVVSDAIQILKNMLRVLYSKNDVRL